MYGLISRFQFYPSGTLLEMKMTRHVSAVLKLLGENGEACYYIYVAPVALNIVKPIFHWERRLR